MVWFIIFERVDRLGFSKSIDGININFIFIAENGKAVGLGHFDGNALTQLKRSIRCPHILIALIRSYRVTRELEHLLKIKGELGKYVLPIRRITVIKICI